MIWIIGGGIIGVIWFLSVIYYYHELGETIIARIAFTLFITPLAGIAGFIAIAIALLVSLCGIIWFAYCHEYNYNWFRGQTTGKIILSILAIISCISLCFMLIFGTGYVMLN